eukprot:jgi/Psemu1/26092/gm1.26092_g
MSPAISASHHSGDHHSAQHAFPLQEIAPAPQSEAPGPSNTPTSQSQQGITSAVTTATAAQAAAAAVAAGRDMKNFSDMEINELLGLIPDEYNAEQEQEAAEAAATAAAKAASALGKGVHHTVTVAAPSLPSNIHRIPSNVTMGKHQTGGSNIDAASYMGAKTQEAHIAAQEAELRSERKRSREKQRRNDVNKQFAELTEVLKNIEREAQEMGRKDDAYGSISTMMAIAATTGPTNRVDLIARTIVHLERLNRTAKKQREEISNLQEQLERTKKAGEDLAEKLKDIMFTQQKQFTTSTFAPYQNTTASLATPTDGASTVSAPNPIHAPTTNSAPQHNPTQQQVRVTRQWPKHAEFDTRIFLLQFRCYLTPSLYLPLRIYLYVYADAYDDDARDDASFYGSCSRLLECKPRNAPAAIHDGDAAPGVSNAHAFAALATNDATRDCNATATATATATNSTTGSANRPATGHPAADLCSSATSAATTTAAAATNRTCYPR